MLLSASAVRLLLIVAVLAAFAAIAGELPWGPV
jgi:hypothetical protein